MHIYKSIFFSLLLILMSSDLSSDDSDDDDSKRSIKSAFLPDTGKPASLSLDFNSSIENLLKSCCVSTELSLEFEEGLSSDAVVAWFS